MISRISYLSNPLRVAVSKRHLWQSRSISSSSNGASYDIFHEHSLTQDQLDLRDQVHLFLKRELPLDVAAKIDKEDSYPGFRELWKKLGAIGLHGITVPKEFGGLGLGFLEHCLAIEAISQHSSAIALSYGAHSNLSINQIVLNGNEKQKAKYLPKMIDGSHIGSLAMSEPNSGSDVTSMRTSAEKKGDYYVLNGSKFWITNGPIADVVIVYAKTNQKDITAFLVDTRTEGFSVGKKLVKMGMRGSPTGELIFDDCKVHESNILGGLNCGVYVLMSGLDYERLVLAAGPLGIMQRACDLAYDYAHQRRQFNQPIGHFQLVQGIMADMFTETFFCRTTLYTLARNLDDHLAKKKVEGSGHASKGTSEFTAKCAAIILRLAEAGQQVADQALQILGGNGYTEDYEASRLLRDARLYRIGAGTSEIRRWLIGREINKVYGS